MSASRREAEERHDDEPDPRVLRSRLARNWG